MHVPLVIVGSGVAGLSAGLFAARAGVKPLILEGLESGGALQTASIVANYPGTEGPLSGRELVARMRRATDACGCTYALDVVERVDFSKPLKILHTLLGETIEASAVILATGAGVEKTNKLGEATYFGRGISACLTCDAPLYKGRAVALIGSDGAAATRYLEALQVTVRHVIKPSQIASFVGQEGHLTGIQLIDGSQCDVAGCFLLTPRKAQTVFLKGALACEADGTICSSRTHTSVAGVFAAGDCTHVRHKQAIIASGEGALAALEALDYLQQMKQVKGV